MTIPLYIHVGPKKLLGSTQARNKSSNFDDGEIGTEMTVLKSSTGSENLRDDRIKENETGIHIIMFTYVFYLTLVLIINAALNGALDSDMAPDIDVASGTITKDLGGAQRQKVGRMGSVGSDHSSVLLTKSLEALSDGVNLLDQSSLEPLLQETTFDEHPTMKVRDGFTTGFSYNYVSFLT